MSKGRDVELTPSTDLLLFKKEVKEAKVEINNEIMVTHRYVQVSDHKSVDPKQDELLSNIPFLCEVILTNASPTPKEISLLY